MLWNLECPVGLRQREMCAHFNEGNMATGVLLSSFLWVQAIVYSGSVYLLWSGPSLSTVQGHYLWADALCVFNAPYEARAV